MRRIVPVALVLLFAGALFALGWHRWPSEEAASPPTGPGIDPTTTRTVPPAPTTTGAPAPTTTIPSDPQIVLADLSVGTANPMEWYGSLVAVSSEEAWATLALPEEGRLTIIGHLEHGEWTSYRLEGEAGRVLGLARGPDGTLWAATDFGVFSQEGGVWKRRGDDPVAGVAVGSDGTVWIGGRREAWYDEPMRLWLARRDGVSWERLDPHPGEAPTTNGNAPIVVFPGGDVWMVHRAGTWVEDDLMHYDGAALEAVQIPGIPDPTPDNRIPAARVVAIAAAPDGCLWAAGYLAADPSRVVVARFDGRAWIIYDWPFAGPSSTAPRISVAVGPDGVVWFAFEEGLGSFDGRVWTTHREGRAAYNVAVAPDGTVWFSDAAGIHILDAP